MAKTGPRVLKVRHIRAIQDYALGYSTVTAVSKRHGLSREWLSKTIHSTIGGAYLRAVMEYLNEVIVCSGLNTAYPGTKAAGQQPIM
jgi:hypothetical protein